MSKVNVQNELIKREFFKWLKEAKGNCDSSVNNVEKAILKYEGFTNYEPFSEYKPETAINFKKWLKNQKYNGKHISDSTYSSYLRYLRKFFTWLSEQPGFKITSNDIEYLNILEKEKEMASQSTPRTYPTLEYVLKLTDSIKIDSEIDLRDRALISFTLLSGMRDKAVITLPFGCFDSENLIIYQNPKKGVKTKFSKYILSVLFKFDEKLVQHVLEWVDHLKTKNFSSNNPLFPRSKVKQGSVNISFDIADSVEPVFWKDVGAMRKIFKNRSAYADLPYFPPHTFRHLAVDIALKHCTNGEQIKAVSQSFGHENVATTIGSYANYEPQNLAEKLKSIDFSGKASKLSNEQIKTFRDYLNGLDL